MQEEKKKAPVTLEGSVERISFRNEENNWTVLELESGGELHKVVGVLPMVNVGETLKLAGSWVDHPSFGIQFRAEYCERHLPNGEDAILRYLSSGAIKGIGQATAIRIVKKFGDKSLEVIEKEPQKLIDIKGLTDAKVRKISEEYAKQFDLREVMLSFSEYGLTPGEAFRCWKKWGGSTIDRIRSNPYLLCSGGLYIGFERADAVSLGMGCAKTDDHRLEAGLLYVLRHNLGNGHTCLPSDKLLRVTAAMLEVEEKALDGALEAMIASLTVHAEQFGGRRFVFLNSLYRAELYTADRIRKIGSRPARSGNIEKDIDAIERKLGLSYAAQQRQAITEAVGKGALILTGGPGTGKTTTLDAIITLLEGMGETVAVAAPTGRAAKRIAELTGREAKTLHRLLEVQWENEETPVFGRNELNPLDADAVVVDELSMVDSLLFESLLRAMKDGCRLILVGDADQLPAVGPGCVLHDLIGSGALPVVQLTEVFRQAMKSHIVGNAHRIVAGQMPVLHYREGDFFFMAQESAPDVVQTISDLCRYRLPNTYGYTVWNGIQVLCPGRKGMLGTNHLNGCLQELLNPLSEKSRETVVEGVTLRTGDKVMHIRNNYDIGWTRDSGEVGQGVFNGDIGMLEDIDNREGTLSVRYEDRVALYTKQEAKDLELAYAVTVHKSQGSEFDAVILPLFHNPPLLCYRNLLYTAVTRAKSLLILVGCRDTIAEMVNNNRKTLRYSGLKYFLQQNAASES